MKTQKSIFFIILLVLAGLIYLVVFTYQNIKRHNDSFHWVSHTHEVIENLNNVHAALLDIESQTRGYVITGNEVFVSNYNQKQQALAGGIRQLKMLISDNAPQKIRAAKLGGLMQEKILFQQEIMGLKKNSSEEANERIRSLRGKNLTDSIEVILSTMQETEQSLLTERVNRNDHFNQMRYTTTWVFAAITFLLLTVLLLRIARENKLRHKAEQKALVSETQYRGLIENSPMFVFTTDLDGKFTYLSAKCQEFTGYEASELVGQNFMQIVAESSQPELKAFYEKQAKQETFDSVSELLIIGKSGEKHWIEQSVVLLQEGGKPVGFQSIAKEITERKYAERLLADAEQRIKAKQQEYQDRLQAILDNMPMIIYLKDLEGNFVMVNRRFHETFQTTDDQIIGERDVNVHTSEAGARKFIEADEQVKLTGKPVEVEDTLMTSEGERNMLIIKFPLYDKNEDLFAVCGVGKDVTEVVRYQRQLIKARIRAEKAERLQEEFLANMSHEIRTPMNGIIGMTNVLETTLLTGEQKEYLNLIQESSGILLALINDILDLSKIKSGRMSVERTDFDLHRTIDSLLHSFQVKAREKGIGLAKVLNNVPQFVEGDQHKLQQVLNNLLSNAVKFTAKGTVSLEATTIPKEDGTHLFVCTVRDTGIGISAENLDQVFESFVQAGTDMVRRYGGTGLGLAITKRLLELQGGKISVSSVLGQGTAFTFELPVTLSTAENITVLSDGLPLTTVSTQQLQGKKILLIEDNLVNQKVTYLMLHKAGLLVDIAGNGKEAVELLEKQSYDLIITDLQMPEMDGFQTAAYIRNKLQLSTPIIAMTASALRNEKQRCLELGMNEYLSKPFAPANLFFHLRRLLLGEENGPDTNADVPEEAVEEWYNLSLLDELDDAEYTTEVLELFLGLMPTALAEIKDSTLREEWAEVYRKAHSLKSSVGLLQMSKMLQTITQIEGIAKSETNIETLETLVHLAAQQYELVKPMLNAELEATRKKILL